jgi:hypothetical protein
MVEPLISLNPLKKLPCTQISKLSGKSWFDPPKSPFKKGKRPSGDLSS